MPSSRNPLVRLSTDRVIAGVCAGLAQHFSIDTRLMRGIFLAGLFASGLTFWLYIALWIILPLDTDDIQNPVNVEDNKENTDGIHSN